MQLKVQKRITADILRCSQDRIFFDPERLSDIKEAITKFDIRSLINEGAIILKPMKGVSRFRARKRIVQRRKGRQTGPGSRKGKTGARFHKKREWIKRIRLQRGFISILKEKGIINKDIYRDLYSKCKGGFFRSKGHIKIYIKEHGLIK